MDILLVIALIMDNKEAILTTGTAIIAGASALAALTPTKKDDNVFNKITNLLALNFGGAKPKEDNGLLLGALKLLSKRK